MPFLEVFGRITGNEHEIKLVLLTFFSNAKEVPVYDAIIPEGMLACLESPDSGCSREHSHFLASSTDYKNMKSLRNGFSECCKKILGETLRFSIKEYDQVKDAEAYICKGHKTDKTIMPNIILNNRLILVDRRPNQALAIQIAHDRYHQVADELKAEKSIKSTWRPVVDWIKAKEPEFFTQTLTPAVRVRLASHLYDYYLEQGRMIQGKYFQTTVLQTVIANQFNSKTLKRCVVSSWLSDLWEWNGLEEVIDPSAQEALDKIDIL